MLGEDGVGVATDGGATVAEDSGDALKLVPQVALDVQGMAILQFGRSKECSLELGEVRFALLLADTLLFLRLGCGGYGCYFCCRLLVVKQIVGVGWCGAVNCVVAVNCGSGVD